MPNHTKKKIVKKYIANDKPIKDIRYIFRPKNGNSGIKDEVLSDIRTLFEPEEDYYKPVKIVLPLIIILLFMKIMKIKKKRCQLKNILMNIFFDWHDK